MNFIMSLSSNYFTEHNHITGLMNSIILSSATKELLELDTSQLQVVIPTKEFEHSHFTGCD